MRNLTLPHWIEEFVFYTVVVLGAVFAVSMFIPRAQAQTMQPAQAITVPASLFTIPSAAYTALDTAMDADCSYISVYNSTPQVIYLAIGASGAEQRIAYDFPPSASAIHLVKIGIKQGVRLSARSLSADATTGFLTINCLQ